ncbi:MAG: alpha/beta hydrolase [Bdellovibrio sp.]
MQLKMSSGVHISIEVHPNAWVRDIAFVHGNLASRRWWMPSLEYMKSWLPKNGAAGSVFLIEFPGCGLSQAPSSLEQVSMQAWARDFMGFLRQLGKAPMDLVGHSTGGLIAALMLGEAPDFFHRGIFLDSVGAKGIRFDSSMHQVFAAMKSSRELTAQVLGSTIHDLSPASTFFEEVLVPDAFLAVQNVGPWVLQALDQLDVRDQMARIQAEVLVLHGEHDNLLPRADSEELARLIPRARFEELKGCGHCGNIENPKLWVQKLVEFLGVS